MQKSVYFDQSNPLTGRNELRLTECESFFCILKQTDKAGITQ